MEYFHKTSLLTRRPNTLWFRALRRSPRAPLRTRAALMRSPRAPLGLGGMIRSISYDLISYLLKRKARSDGV